MSSTERVRRWRQANPDAAAAQKRRERARQRLRAELGWLLLVEALAAVSVNLRAVADGVDDATLAVMWPRLVAARRGIEAQLRAACRQADAEAGAEPGTALAQLDALLAVTTGNTSREGKLSA